MTEFEQSFNIQEEWNYKLLFNDQEPTTETIKRYKNIIEEANKQFVEIWKERTDYLSDSAILRQALDFFEKLMTDFGDVGNVGYYYWLRTKKDSFDNEANAAFNQINNFGQKNSNDRKFFLMRLGKVPVEQQEIFLKSEILKPYHYFLERLFKLSKHQLEIGEEKIMSLKNDGAHSRWLKMLSGFISKEEREVVDSDGQKKRLGFAAISSLLYDKKSEVRESAGQAINSIVSDNLDVGESVFNAVMHDKQVDDNLRGFTRVDEDRLLTDDISFDIVDTLLKEVSSKFSIVHRFYALKAVLMGLPILKYQDRSVELVALDQKFNIEESVKFISKVFAKLDGEFSMIFERMLRNGQIDVHPKKGKRDGAFCVSELKSEPTYVLLNHSATLRDVVTIAHEMGHAINAELSKTQPSLYFTTNLAMAEVASTFMEDFVYSALIENAAPEARLYLIMDKLNQDVAAIFRQVAAYLFEHEIHKAFRDKGFVPKEEISKIFQKHMTAYMGPSVEQSPGSENWWVHWPHIKGDPSHFYVYSYASGTLISKAMQAQVRKNPSFISNVKEFLSAGTSDSPQRIFSKMGIDITQGRFWESGLIEIEKSLNEAEKIAKSLGKIK